MKCYCYLRDVHDKMADGKTVFGNIFGVKFDGPLIPFGATVSRKPISSTDEARLHQFGTNGVLPGMFMGYVSRAGKGMSVDMLIADCEDPSRTCQRQKSTSNVFKHQEVGQEGKLLLPCAGGSPELIDLPQPPRGEMPARGTP